MKIKQKTATQLVLADHLWWVYLIGIVFLGGGILTLFKPPFLNDIPVMWSVIGVVIGLTVIAINKVSTLTFDTTLGTLKIQQRSMLSKTEKSQFLTDIREVRLQGITRTDGKGTSYGQIIQLILKDGKPISFDDFSGVSTSTSKPSGEQRELAQEIATFLNLQVTEQAAPTWSDAMGMIKEQMGKAMDNRGAGTSDADKI